MRKIILLIVLVLIIGCENNADLSPEIDVIDFGTEKGLYHSGEIMNIFAKIDSNIELENVSLRFYGIYASRNRLDQIKMVDLKKGENSIDLDYNAPRCYGCSGIKPGTYQINLDVVYGNEKLTKSVDVEIKQ